ncbi:MAG: HAD-IIIC family phosphatase [Halioglobus sp.]|nr:HAD-IIIC family phosphatase [Halioglobus sp.]
MKISDAQFDKLLDVQSAQEIKIFLAQRKMVPSLPQANTLRQHIGDLQNNLKKIRLGVVHTYTSELLDPWLLFSAALNELDLDIYHAPYGVTLQAAEANSGLVNHSPDVTLLLLTKEDLHPAFQRPPAGIKLADRQEIDNQFQHTVHGLVAALRDKLTGQLIVTILPSPASPGLGMYDDMAESSETLWWSQTKACLAKRFRTDFRGVGLLDFDQLVMQIGRDSFFDSRLWYSSTFPFTSEGALAVSNAVTSTAASLHLTKAKVIALDADNTLWGGVIGEDGINGIALGKEYPGRAFVDFQKRLLSLQQRGFLLVLCSKNNPDDLNEVLVDHPHQVLKNEHFAAQRVNWLPKPDNLISLAEELNLGLDSFIFVDDSDHECSAVRHSLKEVLVVQVPSRPAEIPGCLDAVARLEITALTTEDLEKTAMYSQERQRKSQLEALTEAGSSIDDYLLSLNMKMTVGLNDLSHLSRLSQLTQKTNQFNLTTRRYSEQDLAEKIGDENTFVYHFSLEDNFGDSGIVGLAIIEGDSGKRAQLDTFLMSCRVIGRQAEQAFLHTILKDLQEKGVEALSAEYIPTRKNVLVQSFLPDNGFNITVDGSGDLSLAGSPIHTDNDFPIIIEGPLSQ